MRKRIARVAIVLVGTVAGGAALLTGCGGSEQHASPPGDSGSSEDAMPDAMAVGEDGGAADSTVPQDGPATAESSTMDSTTDGPAVDTGVDAANMVDAPSDATVDAPGSELDAAADVQSADAQEGSVGTGPGDAGEAGSPEAGAPDAADAGAAPDLAGFPHAVDVAWCTRLQQCCLVDSADWDQTGPIHGCVTIFDAYGGAFRIASFNAALDAGSITYNPTQAASCLSTIANLNCGAIPHQSILSVIDECFGAMQGTLGLATGSCVNSLQCAPGEYCVNAPDGGPGECASLQGEGQPCADTANSLDCSYLGNGASGLYCGPTDGGGTACIPSLAAGAHCNANSQCSSVVCNYPSCVNSLEFADPGNPTGECATFTLAADGGGA